MSVNVNPRRVIRWENVRGPRAILALLTGTALGAGLFPVAPGTMGSLAAMPLAYWVADSEWYIKLAIWSTLLVAGTWSAKVFDELMGSADNQNIVMDEVVGIGISAWTAGTHATTLIAAFVLFRIFDIVKIPPVRQLDHWSKGVKSKWLQGFGVMADDVLAGFQALAIILLLQHFQILP